MNNAIAMRFLILFLFLMVSDILISSHIFFDNLRFFHYRSTSGQLKSILYFLNYLVQIMIIVLLLTSQNNVLRKFSYVLIYFTVSIFLTYYLINGYGFTTNEAMVAISDFSFAKEAFSNFSTSIYSAFVLSAIFLTLLYVIKGAIRNKIKTNYLILLILILNTLYIINGTRSVSDRLFYIPYKIVYNYYNAYSSPKYLGEKSQVNRKTGVSKIDKIVYIVDESIVGSKLGINSYHKNTTPFLKSIEKDIYNYGIASSVANCSSSSNTILRSGVHSSKFPDKEQLTLKNANIWAYAKEAGYYTIFIDAQNSKDTLQNNMTNHDFKTIDKYIQIQKGPSIDKYMTDFKIIHFLETELKRHDKVFIYVNKLGAHFPYEEMYNQNKKEFIPTLNIGEASSFEFKEKMLNSYYNAVRWSFDLWWEKVYHKLQNINVLFIHTSDHGQNLFDNESRATHCSANPTRTEADVPILIIPLGNTKILIKHYAEKYLLTNINQASHFNIFPTILFLEGYDLEKNELSLFQDLSSQERFFYSGGIWGGTNFKKNKFNEEGN